MTFETNELFGKMFNYFLSCYKNRKKVTIINIGGSRSGKTIETANLLCYIVDKYKISKKKNKDGNYDNILDANGDENLIVDVYRNELKKVRKTFEDFLLAIRMMGVIKNVEHSSPNADKPWIRFPNGNVISFYGLPEDGTPVEASKSHIVYFNETLEIPNRRIIANIVMRCEIMEIYDSNPSATEHWLFDMGENNENILYTHTTYKDNKFLPKTLVENLESYCPWDLSDYVYNKETCKWYWKELEENRKPNIENIKNGTADKRLWQIYGEGLRCAREGAAFTPIWIDEFPEDITYDLIGYGLDFGFTSDETAFVRVGLSGKNIYAKLLFYEKIQKKNQIIDDVLIYLHAEISKIMESEFEGILSGITKKIPIVCESQDQREGISFVASLQEQNNKEGESRYVFCKVKKYKFKIWGVDLINRFILNVVKDRITEKELLNFVFEEKNGEKTSILHGVKGRNNCDHFIDALMYFCWETLRYFVNRN